MSGQEVGGATPGEPARGDFSATLRAAISASGLSLDRIQARLKSRGTPVSVTALSYWQSGKRQPERSESLAAVRELEVILGTHPGALLGLLKSPRPRGAAPRRPRDAKAETLRFDRDVLEPLLARIGAPDALQQHQQLSLLGLHDRCEIAADGGQRALTTRAVFQANADGQDRWLLVYDQDDPTAGPPQLHALRNCRVGRKEIDGQHGIIAAELLFDRTVDRGDTFLVEYSLANVGPPYPACQNKNWREFRRPIREYLIEIRFDSGATPDRCWRYSQAGGPESAERQPITVDPSGGVHAVAVDFGPGVFGIEWE